jgi:sulfite reductase alpha subunit-like flavoprotein
MKAVVIFESLTGTTRKLAGMLGDELRARGVEATVCNITDVDLQALSAADLVFVGSWTDGIIVTAQKPGRSGRIKNMPALRGKKAIGFVTYALHPGKVSEKMTRLLEYRGAEVIGAMEVRRDNLAQGAAELAHYGLQAAGLAVNA